MTHLRPKGMAGREVQMEESGSVEEVPTQEDISDSASAAEGKTKRNCKPPRKRLAGGGGLLRSLTRRGSLGSSLYETFDPSDSNALANRKLLLKSQGKLTINSNTRSRCFFLYDDIFVCAKQKSPTNFHLKNRVDLRDIWISEYPDSLEEMNSTRSGKLFIGWPIVNAELEFLGADEKMTWMTLLQEQLTRARDNESPNTIVRIVQNDERYTVTKSLLVGRNETVQTTLSRCIKEFHIMTETPEIFQLCALMTKSDLPIPLTGREILYRIQMKYNREHLENDREAPADTEAEPGDGLVFQLVMGEKKSVVLKRTLAFDDNKPAKRVSSWARFFRMTFKVADDGRLYRRNLNELCKNGKLCWRLMMMLSHLFVNGPIYEGVFRKCPARKVNRILQERLDRGRDFNFDKVNACEMSQLIKSFLSCLPECLLTVELYHNWGEVPKLRDRGSMIFHAKSIVARLPESNRLFLRHLICVLRRISQYYAINGMPPKSLSICIGQCLLWLPALKPPTDVADEVQRLGIANSVTEILIENAEEIFGEDCLHLFDHLLSRQALIVSNALNENVNGSCSLDNESRNSLGGLLREEPSSERFGIIRSFSCLNYSTTSLTEDAKEDENARLRQVNDSRAPKLNSSWYLSGNEFAMKELTDSRKEPSLNSSQVDLFSIRHESTTVVERELDVPSKYNKVSIGDANHLLARKPKETAAVPFDESNLEFYMTSVDSSVEIDVKTNLLGQDTDNSSQTLNIGFSTGEVIPTAPSTTARPIGTPRADSLLANSPLSTTNHSLTESEASIFVFPDAPSVPPAVSTTDSVQEKRLPSLPSNSISVKNQSPEILSEFLGETSTTSPLTEATSTKNKPKALVLSSMKFNRITESDATATQNSFTHQTSNDHSTTEADLNSQEVLSSTPDDGYYSPSNATLQGFVGREYDILPSRLEKNYQNFAQGTSSTKVYKQNEQDESQNNRVSSGHNLPRSPSAGLSPPFRRTEFGTPKPGIVRRLTSEIAQRESSNNRPSQAELSPKKVSPLGLLSQPIETHVSKSEIPSNRSKSSGAVRIQTASNDHSQVLHSSKTCCIQECPKNEKTTDARGNASSRSQKPALVSEIWSGSALPNDNIIGTSTSSSRSEVLLNKTEIKTQFEQIPNSPFCTAEAADAVPKADVLTSPRITYLSTDMQASQNSCQPALAKYGSKSENYTYNQGISKQNHSQVALMDCLVKEKPCPQFKETAFEEATLQKTVATKNLHMSAPETKNVLSLHAITGKSNTGNAGTSTIAADCSDAPKKTSKPRLHNSDPKIVQQSTARQGIERSNSDTSGIASRVLQEEDKLNRENKENSVRYQQLKRLSIARQTSTPEKVSKISMDRSEERQDDEIPGSLEEKKLSMKHRDWHKELTEQYMKPTPVAAPLTNSAMKKPSQRSAALGPTMTYTPMPLRAYQGNASKLSKTADKSRKA